MELSVVIVSFNVSSYLDQALITLRDALSGSMRRYLLWIMPPVTGASIWFAAGIHG
jgi:hypothetical protein